MIRLSLLPTSHPLGFQPKWVRSSTQYGPPRSITRASTCSWVGHWVSRLPPLTYRPIKTRFPCGFVPEVLNLLKTATRRIIIQKARRRAFNRATTACKRMVSGSFPPLKGVLFIFRSLYCALSVVGEYLALRDGCRRFSISRTGLSPSMTPPFQTDSAIDTRTYTSPTTPVPKWIRFGLLRFRSPLLTESIFLSVPLVTEMFQFARFAT